MLELRTILLLLALIAAAPRHGWTQDARIAPEPVQPITRVDLHPFARVPLGEPIHLADVATITGPLASVLQGVVLDDSHAVPTHHAWMRLDARSVRDAARNVPGLREQDLIITGDACDVRRIDPAARLRVLEAARPAVADAARGVPLLPHTTHAGIVSTIARTLGVGVGDVRVELDPRDADRVAASTVGRTLTVQPVGTGERATLRVTLYEGDSIVLREVVRAGVEVRRDVAITREPIPRGQIIRPEAILTESRWLPADFRYVAPAATTGAIARRTLDVGQPIDAGAVEPPLAARRGDLVSVHALVGGVVVESIARARRDGREGDSIELESIGAGDKRTFMARLSGKGRAVLVAEPPSDAVRRGPDLAAHPIEPTSHLQGGVSITRSSEDTSRRGFRDD